MPLKGLYVEVMTPNLLIKSLPTLSFFLAEHMIAQHFLRV